MDGAGGASTPVAYSWAHSSRPESATQSGSSAAPAADLPLPAPSRPTADSRGKPRPRALHEFPGGRGVRCPRLEAVRDARHDVEQHLDAARLQPAGVLHILVMEELDIAAVDPRRGKPGDVVATGGYRVGRLSPGLAEVGVPPCDVRPLV